MSKGVTKYDVKFESVNVTVLYNKKRDTTNIRGLLLEHFV